LLKKAVQLPSRLFEKCADGQRHCLAHVRQFLTHARVLESRVWRQAFGATPPRGTLARLSRRFGADLDPWNAKRGYSSLAEFQAEAVKIREWYLPGRKRKRLQRGIPRTVRKTKYVRGRPTAWTGKVQKEYQKLISATRLEGLWNWCLVSRALLDAGIDVHSGTVPVERLWSSSSDMFNKAARRMSLAWFELLAKLEYLRFNYRHFNHAHLPTWAEGDSVLSERVESLVDLARSWTQEDGGLAMSLQRAFASSEGQQAPRA